MLTECARAGKADIDIATMLLSLRASYVHCTAGTVCSAGIDIQRGHFRLHSTNYRPSPLRHPTN